MQITVIKTGFKTQKCTLVKNAVFFDEKSNLRKEFRHEHEFIDHVFGDNTSTIKKLNEIVKKYKEGSFLNFDLAFPCRIVLFVSL